MSYTRRGLEAGMAFDDISSTGIDYHYTVIGIDNANNPATNGHLHTLAAPLRGQHKAESYALDGKQHQPCPSLPTL